MKKLFSYVVDHDHGFAPNPSGGFCTLCKCKYGSKGHKNIVELAEVGDWLVGTGGVKKRVSAGHGKIIYAMRVDETLTLADYYKDRRFMGRIDAKPDKVTLKWHYALVSRHFFYFGKNAIDIPKKYLDYPLEKRGPGFRSKSFDEEFIEDFIGWLDATYRSGVHGPPCDPHSELDMPKCPPMLRRKGHC
jgi:hypothetical protein